MMADPAPPSIPAPAKINLYLHVTGKRPDGYHLLDSLIAFAGIQDRVSVAPADGVSLTIEGPYGDDLKGTQDDNLVLKAARRLGAAAGTEAGADIRLDKRLPVASGIGGGSADAAAALTGLSELWGVDGAGGPDLEKLALELGADVPACLFGSAAFIGGIGEEIDRSPALPPAWLVLVNPGAVLSTPEVFAAREGEFSEPARFDGAPESARALADILARRGNDLTAAAISLRPAIGDVVKVLEAADECLLARMSGSGATCFGLFDDAGGAARAAAVISQGRPEWWVRAAPLLDETRTLRT
ncbi:MAG: 4-(cytidine 5'-diphospho)-2-C-methyl-D-erythritol kinase [Rhodospirillaceae bacterium]|jgi:4-diphosphocytidyl-2-C-methyl-D-erythritol kinase|nr:4-(cytidine 5'-diphospho)-2-C-methyl-D-erythritol kinase [Rhodospirillaceae bacterium]